MGILMDFPEKMEDTIPLVLPIRKELLKTKRYRILQIEIPVGVSLRPDCHVHIHKRLIIIEGCAGVELAKSNQRLYEGEICEIPVGTYHRVENHGKMPLVYVEIRSGSYLADDDFLSK